MSGWGLVTLKGVMSHTLSAQKNVDLPHTVDFFYEKTSKLSATGEMSIPMFRLGSPACLPCNLRPALHHPTSSLPKDCINLCTAKCIVTYVGLVSGMQAMPTTMFSHCQSKA